MHPDRALRPLHLDDRPERPGARPAARRRAGRTRSGTDDLGRDTLARIIHGAQVSLQVGVVAISIALVAGTLIGLVAGYYGGIVDLVLMRVVDIMFAFPGIVLAIVIAGLLGADAARTR